MHGLRLFTILIFFCVVIYNGAFAQNYIADYRIAKESVLRSIPDWAITAAKSNLHILYCGTSHSTQTVDGMRGLMEYKSGDAVKFAVTFNGVAVSGSLDIHYNRTSGTDLSHDSLDGNGHTGYFRGTVSYLDAHPEINVVMWSWCSIENHNVQRYLDNFQELIDMYKAGGSKGRTSANEVKFVFMTGYARGSAGDTPEPPYIMSPYQNHKRIVDFCQANGYFCLDYWSQDTYDYGNDFYKPSESGNNNVQHKAYYDTHTEGVHWFATRSYSGGYVKWPAHCEGTPQHITSNRRAYAAWWILARLAGWGGSGKSIAVNSPNGGESIQLTRIEPIQWNSSGLTGNVKISLWKDGTFLGVIAPSIDPATGSYPWNAGSYVGGVAPVGSGYTVKIKEKGGTTFDTSDGSFDILPAPSLGVTTPNGGEQLGRGRSADISWNCSGISKPLKITLWQGGTLIGVIASNVRASAGVHNWTVGAYVGGTADPGSGYSVKIKEKGSPLCDQSDGAFEIAIPGISISSPSAGDDWVITTRRNITWDPVAVTGTLKITLWQNGTLVGRIANQVDASAGSFSWVVGALINNSAPSGSNYIIKIKEKGASVFDLSDGFTISDPEGF